MDQQVNIQLPGEKKTVQKSNVLLFKLLDVIQCWSVQTVLLESLFIFKNTWMV